MKLTLILPLLFLSVAAQAESNCPNSYPRIYKLPNLAQVEVETYSRTHRTNDHDGGHFVEVFDKQFQRQYGRLRHYQGTPGTFSIGDWKSEAFMRPANGVDQFKHGVAKMIIGHWAVKEDMISDTREQAQVYFHPNVTAEQLRDMKCNVLDQCIAEAVNAPLPEWVEKDKDRSNALSWHEHFKKERISGWEHMKKHDLGCSK